MYVSAMNAQYARPAAKSVRSITGGRVAALRLGKISERFPRCLRAGLTSSRRCAAS